MWWERLTGLIATERSHSPAGASINITYFHQQTNFEHVSRTIYIQDTRMCVDSCLDNYVDLKV
jgi:hypothetical protein